MPEVTCAHCGKSIHKSPSQIAENTTGLYFCNNSEKHIYWREHGLHQKLQPKHVRSDGPALRWRGVIYA